MSNLDPAELRRRPEFVAGHAAGAAWWTWLKPDVESPKPDNPYTDTEQRALWERGFEWGEDDAQESFYNQS